MSVGVSAASATAAAAAADAAVARPGEEGAGETGPDGPRRERSGFERDVASGVVSSVARRAPKTRRDVALDAKSPLAHRASGDVRDVCDICAGVVSVCVCSFRSALVPGPVETSRARRAAASASASASAASFRHAPRSASFAVSATSARR